VSILGLGQHNDNGGILLLLGYSSRILLKSFIVYENSSIIESSPSDIDFNVLKCAVIPSVSQIDLRIGMSTRGSANSSLELVIM
jgi:hypothetical protein